VIRSAALLAVVLVLAACGSGSKTSGGSRCEDVPIGLNNEVASSLASGYTVDNFRAVKSHDHTNVWFISAHAGDPSGGVLYPTWATNKLSDKGTVYAVDAKSLQVAPNKAKLSGVSNTDDGAAAARDCARNASGKGS
jgi:hypothetical protein